MIVLNQNLQFLSSEKGIGDADVGYWRCSSKKLFLNPWNTLRKIFTKKIY